ncbi:hypothetical protein QH494_02640 [Sphingomonas sp. AR_OL41]|uniref:hypothetical protein n=1 Tax=Sphingomonas sp. AR_OL41 TaxID=3042729 RepID=UPI0024813531|nr:hypothetical protein [Sphingomonas sp. AR_OL41]MDH7971067.1 hypothetical protein [Sphingomonas sp. AR_OL41]
MTTLLNTVAFRDGDPLPLLTKTFRQDGDEITKRDYDNAALFDAERLDVENIDDLSAALQWLEQEPTRCLVRGETVTGTRRIRRTLADTVQHGPAKLRAAPTGLRWVMLDFDKLPVASLELEDERRRLQYLVSCLPAEFWGASYHYQWSASAGVRGWDTLSAHLWFYLSEPWLCRTLYERFANGGDWQNCEVDPAPFTPNQIHYTASPIFEGMVDPVTSRSGLVRGDRDEVTLCPWIKPVVPAPQFTPREHYALFGLARFEELLAEIGPDYHRPILRAAAHYYSVVQEPDEDYCRSAIENAIHQGIHGKNSKADYLKRSYLDRVLRGAASKFGGAR